MLNFEYFQAPPTEMDALCPDEQVCSLCRQQGVCFTLAWTYCPELGEDEDEFADEDEYRARKVGCMTCLQAGRFEFRHALDVGTLNETGLYLFPRAGTRNEEEPHPNIPLIAQVLLRRTPGFVSWQEDRWLTHCNDFMVYLGIWEPRDFVTHSPVGDGEALYREMVQPDRRWPWPAGQGDQALLGWTNHYAFRCRHCGRYRGYWDRR